MSDVPPGAGVSRPDHILDPNEILIWWDSPNPRYFAQHPDASGIAISLFAVVFMIVWVVLALNQGGYLWLVGLVGLGFSLWAFSQPFRLYFEAPSVRYLVTDKRAVIATKSATKSIAIRNIGSIDLRSEPGGLGDVLFFDRQINWGDSSKTVRDGFVGIANADAVAREMRRLQGLT
ncbi:hypothetical protein [Bosea sp. 685]|uniref:hypothetical protein n=1 Tax=Bosea sp. 685 TaxID=3080057 RepID=UPI002892AFE7|nr:hypothetical protein [Bosea sp. 685]WNJ89422.1 hypothetical protein RMR04_23880 [Bosea sp. 685]